MSKFKVLEINQVLMTWYGINSRVFSTSNLQAFFNSHMKYYIICFLVTSVVSSSVFVYNNFSSDVVNALDAFRIASACTQGFGIYMALKVKVRKIEKLNKEIQNVVDEVFEDDELHGIYWANEQKCRVYTKILGYYVIVHVSAFGVFGFYAVGCMAFGNFDTSTWLLPVSVSLPFDSTTIFGWFVKWFLKLHMAIAYIASVTTATSYFVSCCCYIRTMCDHFEHLMTSIEQSSLNPNDVEQTLATAIELHTKIFEIFDLLEEISSVPIFCLLPITVACTSMTLFNCEQTLYDFDAWNFIWECSCIVCCSFWTTLYCYSATKTTDRLAALADAAYDSKWYNLPTKYEKYVILLMARSQKPITFTGCGLINCSVETLGKLFRASCSYFMMARTLTHL